VPALAVAGFVQGIAADDVFLLGPGDTFKLIQRGGDIAIQMFSDGPLDRVEPFISSDLEKIGDGATANCRICWSTPCLPRWVSGDRATSAAGHLEVSDDQVVLWERL